MTQWYACIIHHLVQYTICWQIDTLGACNRLLLRCICSVFVFPVFNLWCQDHNVDNTAATNPVEYFSLTYMNRVWFLCHKMCEITSFMTDFHLDNCLMQATIEPLMTQFSHMRIYVPLGNTPRYIYDKDIWIYASFNAHWCLWLSFSEFIVLTTLMLLMIDIWFLSQAHTRIQSI